MDIECVGKVKGKITSFLPFDSFKSTKESDEKVMMKIEQKRHQIGEMIIKGCYVKELKKEVFDLQNLLNEVK